MYEGNGYQQEECHFLHWTYVKWYSEFPEVSYIMKFVTGLDCYQFIRLGEELDDNEVDEHGIDKIYVVRCLQFE